MPSQRRSGPRKTFGELSQRTQREKRNYYQRHFGLTQKQVSQRYNRGTLGPQSRARGSYKAGVLPPDVKRHPEKYPKYQQGIGALRENALASMQRLKEHLDRVDPVKGLKFNEGKVEQRIGKMDEEQLKWLADPDRTPNEIRDRAYDESDTNNPFHYH